MAATARAATAERETYAPRRVRAARPRSRRRARTRISLLSLTVIFAVGLMLPFAYTGVYANLKKTSYTKSDLDAMYWREKIENQRLQLEIDRRSSPQYVTEAAKQIKMETPTQYDYLDKHDKLASAGKIDR